MTTTELPPAGADGDQDAVPPIDPRLRARRIAVKREDGRRRLRRLVRLTGLLAVVLGGWLATRSPLLDVDHIDVSGAEHAGSDEVAVASGIATGDPMTDVDRGAAVAGVEAVPWVAVATVERRWPNRISITVTERTPVGVLVGPDGSLWAVDAEGRLLAKVSDTGGAVAIEGALSADPAPAAGAELPGRGRRAVQVATLLPTSVRAVTAAVVVDDDELWLRLVGEGGGRVRLGSDRAMADKLLAVATVLRGVDPACVAVLDVRVPTVPVLTRVRRCG